MPILNCNRILRASSLCYDLLLFPFSTSFNLPFSVVELSRSAEIPLTHKDDNNSRLARTSPEPHFKADMISLDRRGIKIFLPTEEWRCIQSLLNLPAEEEVRPTPKESQTQKVTTGWHVSVWDKGSCLHTWSAIT